MRQEDHSASAPGPPPDQPDEQDDRRRAWIARELHDNVSGDLTELLLEIELANREHPSPDLDRFAALLRSAQAKVRQLVLELRDVPLSDESELQLPLPQKISTGGSEAEDPG